MTHSSIGMGGQDRSERDKFENELKRIIAASDEAVFSKGDWVLAFQMHCPQLGICNRNGTRLHRH